MGTGADRLPGVRGMRIGGSYVFLASLPYTDVAQFYPRLQNPKLSPEGLLFENKFICGFSYCLTEIESE